MSEFQVTPEDLANASGAVTRPAGDLAKALQAVRGASADATGTPAAGALDGLVAAAGNDVATLQTAVEDLARALSRASQNYQHTETTNATPYGRIR
jgi:hypothetical protein